MELEARYTIKEISVASGVSIGTLTSRRKALGIPSNERGYTLDEVKKMVKKRPARRKFSESHAAALKKRLQDDGIL